ncbi:MAG: glutamine-hydrolyzing carbamoyl-phosphate synthase small subunit [Gammaproteobacteria bacterium]
MTVPAILALADGSLFRGRAIGISGSARGEVVFNTAMTGYQEILSDPSYHQQIVTLTYPHIGNTGTNADDMESRAVMAAGLVIRDLPLLASNWRNTESLTDFLVRHRIVAIADIDTRRLTRILRDKGAQGGAIVAGADATDEAALADARAFPGLAGADLAKVVSVEKGYQWKDGTWSLDPAIAAQSAAPTGRRLKVVAYDFGVKFNILRILVDLGCDVTVVPAQTPAADVLEMQPDGLFLANGPGDPEPCDYAIAATRAFLERRIPVFGICLGHQLLALAVGGKTLKMATGHHGANHPVLDLATGRVMITSQNHGFAVDESSLPANARATQRSLFDGTSQGLELTDRPAYSFQGHPEASPGPHDAKPLFEPFIRMMRGNTR